MGILLKKAEEQEDIDADLLDRIETVLGYRAAEEAKEET